MSKKIQLENNIKSLNKTLAVFCNCVVSCKIKIYKLN